MLMLTRHFLLFFSFRHFNLWMKRDTSLFPPDLIIEVSGEEIPIDTSHIYSGEIFGKSSCFHTPQPGRKHSFLKQHFFKFKLKACIITAHCITPTLSLTSSLDWLLRDFNKGQCFHQLPFLCSHEQRLGSFSQVHYGLLYVCQREILKAVFSSINPITNQHAQDLLFPISSSSFRSYPFTSWTSSCCPSPAEFKRTETKQGCFPVVISVCGTKREKRIDLYFFLSRKVPTQ